MHPIVTRRCLLPFLLLGLYLSLMDCSGLPIIGGGNKPQAWNLNITKNTPATIEVDIVGIAPLEKASFESYSVDKYFSANDPRRAALQVGRDRLTMVLSQTEPWVIDRKDEIWEQWFARGVTEVMLVARLPGKFQDGPADPRRLFIPLGKKEWKAKGKTLEIEIQDTLIRPMTPQKR